MIDSENYSCYTYVEINITTGLNQFRIKRRMKQEHLLACPVYRSR